MSTRLRHEWQRFPDWLHQELMNWSRWCWQGEWPHPLPPNHCSSIEHQYTRLRPEASTDDVRPIPANEPRALLVDRVWRTLPVLLKQVLRAEYPQYHASGRADFGRAGAARRLGLRLYEYEWALCRAGERVRQALGDR